MFFHKTGPVERKVLPLVIFASISLLFKDDSGKCWLERPHIPKAELSLVGEGTIPSSQLDEVLRLLLYILSGLMYKVNEW